MGDHAQRLAALKLSNVSLPELTTRVTRPSYDRTGLTAGIVHIGLGNFHRAHQAWYLHRLMQLGLALHNYEMAHNCFAPGTVDA